MQDRKITDLLYESRFLLYKMRIYHVICRAVRPPPQNSAKAKKLGGDRAARKSPIGLTNN
ncbi:hypothetical protein COF07_07370 [Bacillus wiedmannii]|uniref:Uncharacterized protein n=1 Tax=Bacillus wiedmannii TaxID=1890302 RepID=A0A2C4Z0D3_9BACI|nr:hypothetical protein BW893_01760 [Bacillus wiedmannii]PEA41984.1 hypothetical protein CON83_24450 [Bacillus wiedmannii]PEJ43442.1 hypothetical protein CN889_07835 [Bacillus wiedmannii]PEO14742.1 hypothetical protein CN546_19725 [Bacillus wiedmannii]PEU30789.1 hypothetical protein CN532_07375 [Bacillus wiedmannii]